MKNKLYRLSRGLTYKDNLDVDHYNVYKIKDNSVIYLLDIISIPVNVQFDDGTMVHYKVICNNKICYIHFKKFQCEKISVEDIFYYYLNIRDIE